MQAKIGDVPISNGAFKFANTKRSDASNIAALFASLSMRCPGGSYSAPCLPGGHGVLLF
jgi:hypothetical protein